MDWTCKASCKMAGSVRRLGQESIGEMSKAIKCPKCGHVNRGDLPVCERCGTPLPVADEQEIMRQAMGASFDVKWAVIGGVIIVLLQFASIGVIWGIAGKRFLTGPPRASLLDTTIEFVEPEYGFMKSQEDVKVVLKLDKDLRNTAQKVKSVMFGKYKAKPYLKVALGRLQAKCKTHCEEGSKFDAEKSECEKKEKLAASFKPILAQCVQCREQCKGDCKLEDLPKLPEKLRAVCLQCPQKTMDARKAQVEVEACQKKVDYLGAEKRACKICDDSLAQVNKDMKHCKADGTGCFCVTAFVQRKNLASLKKSKPKKEQGESDKEFATRVKDWEKSIKRLENDIARIERRTVHVFRPKAEKAGPVALKLVFSTGYTVSKERGFYFTESTDARPPKAKKKEKADTPTAHLGFWIMLIISLILYFVGGMFTGRLSPGITMKEPATAGIFAGILYFVFLILIGADFTVVIFSSLIGVPLFAGAAYVGGWVGEKWQGTI